MKIVVLDGYTLNPGDLSWDAIEKLGDLQVYERTSNVELLERAKGATALFTNKVILSREVINKLPELRYIGVMATGYNVVDLEAANSAAITVTNIPAYSADSVAQLVFSFILNISNQLALHAASVREGAWTKSVDFSFTLSPQMELAGKTIGIVGFGKIGKKVAEIASAFGMKVIFQNRSLKKDVPDAYRQVELEELIRTADFISLNCPLMEENREFMNRDKFNQMKKGAVLINTGRGPLINEQDLADALNSEKLAAAGLDVLSTEPPLKSNPLLTAKNCYITPHIAWSTVEARKRLMEILAANFEAYQANNPQNVVNSPN
ncbi:D-2-hydroxyacid dehydrogenase [Mangrovibacterium diazotrophicum]|uniref:Glycerate dehydrogenase n=1 Tax=Mangrovibacterium diazotrophicum TaxID=1261403 RepID=A0A419W3Q2_9BACT|nr:D-2-hydroxyacid dehydrogenase [Mangrovibacterium diazotrophicum]RKD90092.1 glycerate dehydrogenase [Mangrovibacterium diazotrophicum]